MRFSILVMLSLWLVLSCHGQGTIWFATRDAVGAVDAPVTFAWAPNEGVGEGFTAQLYGGPPGASIDSLQPLYPTTTFRTDATPIARRYVYPVVVAVPGQPPLSTAVFVMRVFNGPDWESSDIRGESIPTVAMLGDEFFPGYIVDLRGFYVYVIPEPSVGMLVCFGAGLVLWLGRKRR